MTDKNLKQYNKFAKRFTSLHSNLDKLTNKYYYPRFKNHLNHKKILDLGCGEAKDLKYFLKNGAEVYGIDASEEMVTLAKNNLPESKIKLGYFEKIPFTDSFFDVIASKYSLQSSKDIDSIYKEVNRTLKKDGLFIFLVVHPIRQFMEKKKEKKDYFKKEDVNSILFGGKLTVKEPTHTLLEYLSPYFLKHFEIIDYDEKYDPSNAEKINGDKYPAFMIIKARKK